MPAVPVSLLLGGEGGKLEAVSMEVMEVSTPPDEAFVVKAAMSQGRVPAEVGDIILPLESARCG